MEKEKYEVAVARKLTEFGENWVQIDSPLVKQLDELYSPLDFWQEKFGDFFRDYRGQVFNKEREERKMNFERGNRLMRINFLTMRDENERMDPYWYMGLEMPLEEIVLLRSNEPLPVKMSDRRHPILEGIDLGRKAINTRYGFNPLNEGRNGFELTYHPNMRILLPSTGPNPEERIAVLADTKLVQEEHYKKALTDANDIFTNFATYLTEKK